MELPGIKPGRVWARSRGDLVGATDSLERNGLLDGDDAEIATKVSAAWNPVFERIKDLVLDLRQE
ncbi:hypothetical protein MARA_22460 [Mycolicibacterium arabiense]|uniref:Uncharacterized protein n=1 Tax=Mycolicibacterium arabiense TaxID=1286181 RepID=A0A7I7RVW9_9MYCO|nr:hypothetical protein [Mycolicibacterium arabiense]MCV7375624.1 hypothetical protein [Mycolicibacterium arabiense]BBY48778.1 hypothetical protein MARA_22460 [Mycolicibacterium arabiense]